MNLQYAISDKQCICFTDYFCYIDNNSIFNVPKSIKEIKPLTAKHIFALGDCSISEENAISKLINGVSLMLKLGFRQHYSYKDFCNYLITGRLSVDSYSYLVYYGGNLKVVFYHNVWEVVHKPIGFEFLDKSCKDVVIFYEENIQPVCSDDVSDRRGIFHEQIIEEINTSSYAVFQCLDKLLQASTGLRGFKYYNKPVPMSSMTDGWLLNVFFEALKDYHDVLSLIVPECRNYLSLYGLELNMFLYHMLSGGFKSSDSTKDLIEKYKYVLMQLYVRSTVEEDVGKDVVDLSKLEDFVKDIVECYFDYFLNEDNCYAVLTKINNSYYPTIMFTTVHTVIDASVIEKVYSLVPEITTKALSRKISAYSTLRIKSKGVGKDAYLYWDIGEVLDYRFNAYQIIIASLMGMDIDSSAVGGINSLIEEEEILSYTDKFIYDRVRMTVFDSKAHDRIVKEINHIAFTNIAFSFSQQMVMSIRKEIAFLVSYIFNGYIFERRGNQHKLVVDKDIRAVASKVDTKVYKVIIDFGVESSLSEYGYDFLGGLYIPEDLQDYYGKILAWCSVGLMIRYTPILDEVRVVTPDNLMWEWSVRDNNVSMLEVTYVG